MLPPLSLVSSAGWESASSIVTALEADIEALEASSASLLVVRGLKRHATATSNSSHN